MARKASRGRRPPSRQRRGWGLLTWLLIIMLVALVALLAFPHLLQRAGDETAGEAPDRNAASAGNAGDAAGGPSARSRSLPADNRVLERPGNHATVPPSPAEDQEANEVAAMVSQGVVSYDQAVRNQQQAPAAPPGQGEPAQH